MTLDLASLDPVRKPTDPPDGWYHFGTHAGWDNVPPLEFSAEGEDGFPLFERPITGEWNLGQLAASMHAGMVQAQLEHPAMTGAGYWCGNPDCEWGDLNASLYDHYHHVAHQAWELARAHLAPPKETP